MIPTLTIPWREKPVPWAQAAVVDLATVSGSPAGPATRVRLRAGPGGLDVRFHCRATRLNAEMLNDGDPLYLEDVIEVFLQPIPGRVSTYLEYEVSPLGRDFTLLVSKGPTGISRWRPWGAAPADRPRCRVRVSGGVQEPYAAITGWLADLHLPWTALAGIAPAPRPGTRWQANFYRIDHGSGVAYQAWSDPGAIDFHRPQRFGTIVFSDRP